MDRLVRNSYTKVDGDWVVTKSTTLVYQKVPYTYGYVELLKQKIQDALTPDLLTKKYRKINETNPLYGHCYHATQAMYYLLDCDTLISYSGKDWRGEDHWWLTNSEDGYIIDVTADQYYSIGEKPPHDVGKPTKWYGWKGRVHKRTMVLMQKIQSDVAFFE